MDSLLKEQLKQIKELVKENARLNKENEKLKKAIHSHVELIQTAKHDKHKVNADKKLWKHVGRHQEA